MIHRIKAMVMLVVFSLGLVSQPAQKVSAAEYEKIYYAETQEDEFIAIQKALTNYEEEFTIRYLASNENNFDYEAIGIDWNYINEFYYSDASYTKSLYIIDDWAGADWSDGEYVTADGQKWFSITYSYNYQGGYDKYKSLYDEIDKIIKDSKIATASDYDKAAWAYNWLCNNITYDYSYKIYDAYNTFVNKSGVCDGYAHLFAIFADQLGLNSRYVDGWGGSASAGGKHAWNIVELDGQWYSLDTTWGAAWGDKYFLKGTEEFNVDHKLNDNLANTDFNFATSNCTGSSQISGIPASVYDVVFNDIDMERLNIGEEYKWLIDNTVDVSLIFSSSDSSVASVDSKGMITANKAGITTVQAVNTDLGIIQTCEITVSKEKASITDFPIIMNAEDVAVSYGKTAQIALTLSESNEQLKDVKYNSADKKIATVDKNGKVTGIRVGTTKITVSYTGGNSVTIPVTVKETIKTKTATVNSGDKISLRSAVAISKNGYKDLVFKTSNKKVATVSKTGYVTGKAGGECEIRIFDKKTNKKVATVNVTVTTYETININDLTN